MTNPNDLIIEMLPLLIPLTLVQYGLAIAALVHALKSATFKFGNKTMWILIILLVNIIGPVCYFIFGKGEPKTEDDWGDDND